MQNHKKWGENQREQEETGLFPHFLQVGRLGKAKKIVYFLSNKKYEKTNNQYFACKKTGKHQSLETAVGKCSKEIKKRGISEKNGKEGKEKQNRRKNGKHLLSVLLPGDEIVIFFAMLIFCCYFFGSGLGLRFRQ